MEERTVLKRTMPAAFNTAQPNGECILARALVASSPVLVTLQRANGTLEGNRGRCRALRHTLLSGDPNLALSFLANGSDISEKDLTTLAIS